MGAVLELPSVFYRAAVGVRGHVLPLVYYLFIMAARFLALPSVYFFSF